MAEGGVLVVRLSSLGDVVLTTPVFENLKRAFPSRPVAILVKKGFADVFRNNPFVDEVLVFESKGLLGWAGEIRRRRFDVFLDLHDTIRSRLWSWASGAGRVARYDKRTLERRRLVSTKSSSPRLKGTVVDRYLECLPSLGVPVVARQPRLYPDAVESVAEASGADFVVGVAPGAAHATKRWAPERFAEAADRLAGGKGKVLIFGAASDRAAADAVAARLTSPFANLAGETSLRRMFALLSKCRVVLTNDSGAMHAAAALGVPTVAVFGPTVEAFGFSPTGSRTAVVQLDGLECRPCHLHGLPACPLGHFKCMQDIPSDRVTQAAQKLLTP